MPTIRLEKLVKKYKTTEILHGIDLEMNENEFTVLVGPSGCGKSTTLRMIAGLETVSGGEIYFNDKPVSHLEPKDRDLAMVFQDYALYPHMNVAENMSFTLRLQKRPKSEINQKVREVSAKLGLSPYLSRKPGELSGGQRQRVAMGRALVKDSSTFLFDEPLSNLDAKLRGHMRAELALLRQEVKKNMIYVTHDQVEAMTLGDRIVVMNHGSIQQQGTPQELFKTPANIFVAGFIGMPPMNFLNASIQEIDGKLHATGDGFSIRIQETGAPSDQYNGNKDVILGIRPSDLEYSLNCDPNERLSLKPIIKEYIGAQTILICSCGTSKITVEVKNDIPLAENETMNFYVRPGAINIFDKKTEKLFHQNRY